MKAELEVKSPIFRAFNRLIGPSFKRLRDSMLKQEELADAKRIAAETMAGEEKGTS